ncbi:MAG: hypothetical protein R3241_03180 [Rheinheimera sp.]|nr:hypothetical protein [Rheinheimera sp.]
MKTLTALLLCSAGALANTAQQEQQINMMLAVMARSGALEQLAQCVEISPAELESAMRQTLSRCGIGDINADEPDAAHRTCMQQHLPAFSGVPSQRWQACDSDDATEEDPLLAELDALTARIGERDPTAAEQQQMDDIIARMQQRGVAEMQQMVDGMIDGSQGTASSITLPIFPQSQLLINLPARGTIDIAEQTYATLPGASFITTASPQQVLEYYRQQLPGYQMHRPALLAATDVALMQHVPAGFDYSRDTGKAFSIPHIYIQPAQKAEQQRLAGAQTLFFVYYPPAD